MIQTALDTSLYTAIHLSIVNRIYNNMSVEFYSPVGSAFPNIQWDALGSLRLTAQETALLRMAETNPIDYTLADSRDASMYARVLLKLLAEAAGAGAGTGQ